MEGAGFVRRGVNVRGQELGIDDVTRRSASRGRYQASLSIGKIAESTVELTGRFVYLIRGVA
jgi:hypothetical protein